MKRKGKRLRETNSLKPSVFKSASCGVFENGRGLNNVIAILRFQVKLVRSADALPQKFMTRSIIYVNYTAVFVPQTFVLAKEYVGKQLK